MGLAAQRDLASDFFSWVEPGLKFRLRTENLGPYLHARLQFAEQLCPREFPNATATHQLRYLVCHARLDNGVITTTTTTTTTTTSTAIGAASLRAPTAALPAACNAGRLRKANPCVNEAIPIENTPLLF